MSVWAVFAIGTLALLMLSVIVGLFIGAILGHISRQVTELLDLEAWQGMPSAPISMPDGNPREVTWGKQPGGGLRQRVTNRR